MTLSCEETESWEEGKLVLLGLLRWDFVVGGGEVDEFVFVRGTEFLDTIRYSPLHKLSFSSCGGLRPSAKAFFGLREIKKNMFTLFVLILGHFRSSVVTSVNL